MRKLSIRLIAALVAFVLGVAATTAWLINRQLAEPETRLVIPAAGWEPIFFREINAVTKLAGLTDIRKTILTDDDVEARVWWGGGLEPLEGVALKRVAREWSAVSLKADRYYEPQKAERIGLLAPKSGWEACWQRLVDAGILTLPDASEIDCNVSMLDGMGIIVEINKDRTYRTYMYGNPFYAKCDEAKRMLMIGEIIADEFGL